ncbi:MAG: c-type cytochrome [Bacteroidales bacterium]|nr:c-type cytochrome [Bacteroidales bacterium]
MKLTNRAIALTFAAAALLACSRNGEDGSASRAVSDAKYVGKAVGNFDASEWYPGGQLGTTTNIADNSYEDPAPAVTAAGLDHAFNLGEYQFERTYNEGSGQFGGLGPAHVRNSCLDCHPAYGHGQWKESYVANGSQSWGNGYLLVVYYAANGETNDGPYVGEVTGMPQTMVSAPFLPPIDETKIQLSWTEISEMESGLPMKFRDGETYKLQYPTLYIPEEAFNTDPTPYETARAQGKTVGFRLESTIGVIGVGLIDALDEDEMRETYRSEAAYFASTGAEVAEKLNPAFWDASVNDFASSAYYGNWQSGTVPFYGQTALMCGDGYLADGTLVKRGSYSPVKRFTYAMTRGSLQDGAGANAIWNITNVSRPDRPFLYTTAAWAKAMSGNADVIAAIKADPASPYYADGTDAGIREAVYALLCPSTNQFDNPYHNFTPEMSADEFYNFMVWHRGLAIPRARDLNDATVQKGKELFNKMGCASCHKAKWTTGDDNYWSPALNGGKPLPRFAHQTIYPYSDFIQHKLHMKNDIHGSWCRTTPLWGRGLSAQNTGRGDRLHDCRARNVVESIMWHAYSKDSDAYDSAEQFYNLSKEERDAVVKFINSI